MRNCALILFVCFWAGGFAQELGKGGSVDTLAEIKESHLRAQSAVQAEQDRAKKPLCPKAMNTRDINECYSVEFGTTDDNYQKLVRALSALLHPGDDAVITPAPTATPFDDTETIWQTYRKIGCEAARDVYAGTIRTSMELGCRITLTRHHMNELWAVYSEVGMH
jgi:hypothetical protein